MLALTVCQPYAELIARGEKLIENRTWPTALRGRIGIHAGKSRAWLSDGDDERYPGMAYGALVCWATLYDCVRVANLPPELRDSEHANGPWCFLLKDITREVAPVPMRGAQGFWKVEGPRAPEE